MVGCGSKDYRQEVLDSMWPILQKDFNENKRWCYLHANNVAAFSDSCACYPQIMEYRKIQLAKATFYLSKMEVINNIIKSCQSVNNK